MERLEITQALALEPHQNEFIKQQMVKSGVTQEALSIAVDIDRANLANMLGGQRKWPLGTLRAVCEELGIRVTARLQVGIHY